MTVLSLERRPLLASNVTLTRALFVKRFPACFAPRGKRKRPLKIGIDRDLAAATDLPIETIKSALRDYTSGPTYLRGFRVGADRVDLLGRACGNVTERDAAYARREL